VARTTHDRAPLYDGGSMVRLFLVIEKLHESKTGQGN
jgi:hypothetical protein